ncbi:MAG: hypothetical protein ACXW1D_00280 [Halobacteriota archaeon]
MEDTVLRLEWPDGGGIYYQEGAKSFCNYMDWDVERHPTPYNDDRLMSNLFQKSGSRYEFSEFHFRFSSLDQLRRWFFEDKILRMMHDRGVVVSEYVCHWDDVVHGHTQAIFLREKAKRHTQYGILEYFGLRSVDSA